MNYQTYRRNRDLGIQHDTLARLFGDTPCAAWREQYREEVRQWLQSPQVNRVCDQLRSEQ